MTLGLQHSYRPIARNWPRVRKRYTAIIACCNTVFVGLQAGIYVGRSFAVRDFEAYL